MTKSFIVPLVAAIVLAVGGAAFSIAGQTEKRVADVHDELATLQYAVAANDAEAMKTLPDLLWQKSQWHT